MTAAYVASSDARCLKFITSDDYVCSLRLHTVVISYSHNSPKSGDFGQHYLANCIMYFTEDKNLKIHKKINVFVRACQLLAFLTVVAVAIYSHHYGPSWGEVLLRDAKPLEFHGQIDSIYHDEHDHNNQYAILSDGYRYGVYADWEFLLEKGDSLSKDAGNLKVFVYRNDGKQDTLDYEKLAKGLDHDKNGTPRHRNPSTDTTTRVIHEIK